MYYLCDIYKSLSGERLGKIICLIFLMKTFINTIANVPIVASKISFKPINTPIAATHQIVPAVLMALTLFSSIAIIPAPIKPIP